MASLTGQLVAETYKALLKLIDNDILTASEKQITDGFGGGSNVFIDSQGFLRANKYKVTNGLATQFLKADGSLDSNAYLTSITGAQVITALGYTPVPTTRTITINGETHNLAADNSWTVAGTAAIWGNITGTLSNQTDLQNALNSKYNNPTGTISQYIRGDGTLATFPTMPGGLPTGGSAGQILAKIDATDYNAQWIDNYATQTKNEVKLGQTLTKGTPVYVSSANGTNMIVSRASNTSEALSSKTFGLLETGGATNDLVKCVTFGLLAGLDTSTAQAGDPVWLGPNGTLIFGLANKPVAPAHLVYIGVVTRVQSNNGEIFVNVQNGFELKEIHDVYIADPANNHGLFYDIADGLWKNKSIATVLGGTPIIGSGTTNYLPKFTAASVLGNSNIQDSGSLITLGSNTNISSGSLGIGTSSLTGYNLRVTKNITGATTSIGIHSDGTIQSDVTGAAYLMSTNATTVAAAFTLNALTHFRASQATYGAGSTVTSQYGFSVDSSLIGATNNYGFFGNIPAATNRYNLYMAGTAGNYLGGSLGIGAFNITNTNLFISKTMTGSIDSYHVNVNGIIQSDVTSSATYFRSSGSTAAASFTLGTLNHYLANQSTIGAGSTVTNQFGFRVESTLTGATNNYGFYGNIASGTNRWNLYMNGTANNYLNGKLLIGTTTDAGYKLDVTGTGRFTGNLTASAFVKQGGTSVEFLKADGSVDSTNYQRLDKMVSNLLPSATEYPNSNAVIAALALKADAANPVFTGNMTISGAEPKLYFTDTDQNPDYFIGVDAGFFRVYDQTAGATRFVINSDGNISTGVGKSITAGSFVKESGTASQFLMADGSVSTLSGLVTGSGTTNYISKWTSASGIGNSLIFDNGTNVGINTNDPKANFHVNGSTATLRIGPWFSSSDRDFIELQAHSTDTKIISPNERFHIDNSSAGLLVLNGLNNGNVSIGTTTDAGYKLDVAGNTISRNTLTVGNGTTAANSTITFLGVFGVSYAWNITNDANGLSFTSGVPNTALKLAATGAATFSSSVTATQIGIGVSTLPSWTGARAIQAGLAGSYYGDGQVYGWQTGMVANAYRTGTLTWAYQNTGIVSTRVEMSEINPFSIFIAPSGTAGNTISYTQAFTLNASGNVGIGTTSPVSKLQVQDGDIRLQTSGGGPSIIFGSYGVSTTYPQGQITLNDAGFYGGHLDFFTKANGASTNSLNLVTRIASTGNFLIGTTTDAGQKLDVAGKARVGTGGSTNGGLFNISGGSYNQFNLTYNNTWGLLMGYGDGSISGGYHGLNVAAIINVQNAALVLGTNNAAQMTIAGSGATTFVSSVTATSFFESSDIRLKTLIESNPIVAGIENLQCKLYEKNGKIELGYFAQDAELIMPYAVTKNADGFLNLSYREIHTAKIARLEKEVAELKAQLNLN
jgi:hypothetical protein